jgi:alanine dehydrogenase
MALLLNQEEVIKVLQMKDCINIVEEAFRELANGSAVLPLRINITPPDGLALYMPAYLKEMGALACKVVSVYKNNPKRFGIPTTIGKVLLQNPETGEVICIMDGGYLTAVRTGAVSGVASKYLAKKDHNKTVGIFGAGVQAKMQLWAQTEVLDIEKVYIYDTDPHATAKFIDEMELKLNLDISSVSSPDKILDADIICTATSSPIPIFDGKKVRPGTHINGVGSHTPNARELDDAIIKRSKFIGDSKEACFSEAGDIMIPLKEGVIEKSHFYAELGELLTSKKEGRVDQNEITLFKSNGLAIQDSAAAKLVYDRALSTGIGTEVTL